MKRNAFKTALLLIGVIAASAATTLTVLHLTNRNGAQSLWQNDTSGTPLPAAYAKFSAASSALDTDFTVAAELSINAVVHVKTTYAAQRQQYYSNDPLFDFFFGRPRQQMEVPQQQGSGSGVILSSDGYIVTNNHVIDKSSEIEVVLNDKRTFKAELVGADPNTDIALLKIDATDLSIIVMGNSDNVKVGEWVLAVGNPFNLTSTVTAGIVSAKARNINILNAEMKIESFIQTDAAVNPGNSGGALVNTRGELIGINTAIASQTGSYSGYSFAVPTSIVSKVVADLKQHGVVQRAVLGVQIQDITSELQKEHKLSTLNGAYVAAVIEEGAAAKAGIKTGDVITKINGTDIKSSSELQEQIGRYRPSDKINVTLLRDGKPLTIAVTLKNRQGNTDIITAQSESSLLGVTFQPVPEKTLKSLRLNYGIQIKSITKGKMEAAGIQNGFIVLKVNNRSIRTEEEFDMIYKTALNSNEQEKVLFIAGVYPNGKVAYYAVNLAE